jgi:hypothetical protein
MKGSIFTIMFMLLISTFITAQTEAPVDDDRGWYQGDILAGANTTLDNTSLLNVQFSPVVGYAVTDYDMVTTSIIYADSDGSASYSVQVGYQRAVWLDGLYVGAGLGLVNFTGESNTIINANVGYFAKLGNYWYVSPRLGFETSDGDSNLMTQLTFGFVL